MADFDNRPDGDQGRERMEELLRRSLESRAQDVRPDPATWRTVSRRIRRGQTFRWALSGVTAAAAVVLAAVVLPGILTQGGVDLRPADPGGTGDPEATETSAPIQGQTFCGGPDRIAAVFAREGEGVEGTLWARCVDGSESFLSGGGQRPDERHAGSRDGDPTFAPDGRAIVFERTMPDGTSQLVHLDLASGDEQVLMGGRLPAFAPDGRLAWVMPRDGAQDLILVGELFAEPEMEFPVMPASDGEWFDVRRLAWDASGQILYAEAGYEESVLLAYELEGREPEPRRVLEAGDDRRFAGPAPTPVSREVVAVERCCTDVEGPFGQAELRLLDYGSASAESGAMRAPGATIAAMPGPFDPNGSLWASFAQVNDVVESADEGVGTAWGGGVEPAWLVGDGTRAWLVEYRGDVTLVADLVSSGAMNPRVGEDAGRPSASPSPAQGDGGLPEAVATTRDNIRWATEERDYEMLFELMAPDISYSFGDDGGRRGAIDMLRAMEEQGQDPFVLIAALLDVPYGTYPAESAGTAHFWPRAFVVDPADWIGEDIEAMMRLGADDEQIERWRDFGGYTGWRLGITADGDWTVLIAGD